METFHMVIPAFNPGNRSQKRKMLAEFKRVTLKLGMIEQAFGASIMGSDARSYQELFDGYGREYTQTADNIKAVTLKLNKNYFLKVYDPMQEQYTSYRGIHKFFDYIRAKLWWV